jgi:hypothetical protein
MAQQVLARDTFSVAAQDVDIDAYDRKVLSNFTNPDGSIKAFPAQQKKIEVVLRYVLQTFEPGKRYTEKQVNELLSKFNPATATLRRALVQEKMLVRAAGEYWRPTEKQM